MGDENNLKGLLFCVLMWTCNACEQIRLNPNHVNSKMVNHVIESKKVSSISVCVHDCMVLVDCQSFNYGMDNNMCDLNSANSETAPGDFVCMNRKMFSDIKVWPKVRVISLSFIHIQSTLVISNSKGLSEILRDIRTSTYQICRIEKNIIGTTTFNKFICNWTLQIRDILKILWKRGEIAP